MTKEEALNKIKELEEYIRNIGKDKCDDELFLLSAEEYEALKENISPLKGSWWWLRSPGRDQSDAAYVDIDGSVCYGGDYVSIDNSAVRPAFKISKDHLMFYDGAIRYDMIYDYIGEYDGYNYFLARYAYGQMLFDEESNKYVDSEVRKYLLSLL